LTQVTVSFPAPGVGQLLMESPPYNFTTPELYGQLDQALTSLRESGARVVVVASDVEGYFLAHGSLENIIDIFSGREASADDAGATRTVLRELDLGPMVSIAAVEGQAWGGGAEVCWASDFRVASESATFGQPEVMLGTVPGLGGAAKLARLAGEAAALRFVLDGRPVAAREAHSLGLVHRLTAPGRALAEALEWAEWLAQRPEWALAACKDLVKGSRDLPLRDALRREISAFADYCSRPEVLENIRAAQRHYDAGRDSFDAFALPRE
jgi:enoyl-CoA hydratase/carnithine racemase